MSIKKINIEYDKHGIIYNVFIIFKCFLCINLNVILFNFIHFFYHKPLVIFISILRNSNNLKRFSWKLEFWYACIPLLLFIVDEMKYLLSGKQMNYNYPISIARKNALNFTFETKIRVTRFASVKTLYLFNCIYPLE